MKLVFSSVKTQSRLAHLKKNPYLLDPIQQKIKIPINHTQMLTTLYCIF